jgi:hypothetical protein
MVLFASSAKLGKALSLYGSYYAIAIRNRRRLPIERRMMIRKLETL